MDISSIRVSELSRLSSVSKPTISKYFKDQYEPTIERTNTRITGISPGAAHDFLKFHNITYFDRGAVVLSANLCGGVGKTSGTHSLGMSLKRIVNERNPILLVDTDSQGSLTSSVFGKPADDSEPILIDFLEKKASIKDILTQVCDNVWLVKSNLNQVYIDKVLSKPSDIKRSMLMFYNDVFLLLGSNTKIFQDHTPQLSSLFASSVCALHQLPEDLLKTVIIPMRSDDYAIDGAIKILNELDELRDTFSLPKNIDTHCYYSSIDRRVSSTMEALKAAQKKPRIVQNLSSIVIRYCSEIPKSIQNKSNVYNGKNNKAAEDYQDLLQYLFSYKRDECDK